MMKFTTTCPYCKQGTTGTLGKFHCGACGSTLEGELRVKRVRRSAKERVVYLEREAKQRAERERIEKEAEEHRAVLAADPRCKCVVGDVTRSAGHGVYSVEWRHSRHCPAREVRS